MDLKEKGNLQLFTCQFDPELFVFVLLYALVNWWCWTIYLRTFLIIWVRHTFILFRPPPLAAVTITKSFINLWWGPHAHLVKCLYNLTPEFSLTNDPSNWQSYHISFRSTTFPALVVNRSCCGANHASQDNCWGKWWNQSFSSISLVWCACTHTQKKLNFVTSLRRLRCR